MQFWHCYISDVISGVPQGSVLGPILFLIFINDVVSTRCGKTSVKMFADDLKLYCIYNSANGVSDLQQSLDLLVSWSNVWQLKINISKCHVLPIRSKSRSNTFNQYSLDGVLINNVSSTTDLCIKTYPLSYTLVQLSLKHFNELAYSFVAFPSGG